LKKKQHQYLYLVILLISFNGIFAQDLTLEITSYNKNDIIVLKRIKYLKKHTDSVSVNLEIDKISNHLRNIGYFTNKIQQVKKINKQRIIYFKLHQKTLFAVIRFDSISNIYFKTAKIINNTISIPIKKLQSTILEISNKLDKEGKSFSKIQLKNFSIKNDTLFSELNIHQSKERIINKVIIKEYENFPKSYLKNFYNIRSTTVFNQQKIKAISEASKSLQFLTETKPPEVLFTKDSTFLYLYFKKKQNNSFDGIVNFANKENGDILLNGNIDLKLNNMLNTGETFQLFWNRIAEERQEFKLTTESPYLFNSKFTPQLSFSIYKQDSTFLNTKFDSKLFYNLNEKLKLGFTYTSETSENLKVTSDNIKTFNNYFLGFQLRYTIPRNDFFSNNQFHLEINPTFGKRTIDKNTSNQFKIEASSTYLWDLSLRNKVYIKSTAAHLNSDLFIDNELFRIGGANSIRGFNEQSIFTNSYLYFNLEYRYLTSEQSYFYTITDFGKVKTNFTTENLIGIGLGYLFKINNSHIKLSTALGRNINQQLDVTQFKFIINWRNFF
jgi:hypothetical protein